MSALVVNADARDLSFLADESVDLVVTSPPYFSQRSYRDGGEHFGAQIGSEPHPRLWLEAMWDCAREWWRVLKPSGSVFVNLGDKRAGSGGHNNSGISAISNSARAKNVPRGADGRPFGDVDQHVSTRRNAPDRYQQAHFGRVKSRQLLPERFTIGMEDGLGDPEGVGWIVRQVIVWEKANCLSGGSRVYARTPTGDRPIMLRDLFRAYRPENVQLWNGAHWTPVVGWSQIPTPGDALELELRNGQRIGCTREHRWPTQRGLLSADQLTVGDVLDSTRLPEPSAASRANRWIDRPTVGWFVGMYLAEGSRSGTTIQIAGHIKETARGDKLKLIAREFDGSCHRYQVHENGITDNLHGPILAGIIDNFISGRNAHDKRLTMRAWQQSDDFLIDVLTGYLEGDGGYDAKNDRWRIGFCENDELVADLRTLCARLGVSLRLKRYQAKMGDRWFPSWRGELRFHRSDHWSSRSDTEVVAIRASRARYFYDVGVADDPHLFALASGVLTHNSLPESVTDRTRDNFEYIYHFTKSERYYSAVDEIREPGNAGNPRRSSSAYQNRASNGGDNHRDLRRDPDQFNPLGKLPGSVWRIASEPLGIPEWAKAKYRLPDHFAAFPSELPRRLILGWSPPAVCLRCGEGRRPVVEKRTPELHEWAQMQQRERTSASGGVGKVTLGIPASERGATIIGYACACCPFTDHAGSGRSPIPSGTHLAGRLQTGTSSESDDGPRGGRVGPWREYHFDGWTPPPSHPAVVLDPFGGTGTTAGVANALGRNAIITDLSEDYCRLAKWRLSQPSQWAKATARSWAEAQQVLL